MSPKTMGIVAGAALAGAGALCARHMQSKPHDQLAKGWPCMPGNAPDDDEQPPERSCPPQSSRSLEEDQP